MSSFMTKEQLDKAGFKSVGSNVLISCKASIYNASSISIGDNVRIDDYCLLTACEDVVVGNYVHIAAYSAIYGSSGVVFEDFSGLSPRCSLFSESDDFSGNSLVQPFFPGSLKPGYKKGLIVLRKFAQVGTNSTIMPGVQLGEGVAIGSHSLVLSSCDPWGIYAGIPVKYIKERSKEIVNLSQKYITEHFG